MLASTQFKNSEFSAKLELRHVLILLNGASLEQNPAKMSIPHKAKLQILKLQSLKKLRHSIINIGYLVPLIDLRETKRTFPISASQNFSHLFATLDIHSIPLLIHHQFYQKHPPNPLFRINRKCHTSNYTRTTENISSGQM